jgi:methionyl-tRNA formyltransferase
VTRTIAVAATAPFGADVLERLAASHEIAAVLTRPDAPAGRGRKLAAPPAKQAAERLGLPVLQPERLDEDLELDAPTVVVVAYGKLIPEALLEQRLWLNVHPSLLPRWRGAAPVERAIMAGDDETGVTIHRTTPELDAGPIAAQRAFLIGAEDDAGVVYEQAGELAAELLEEVLSGSAEFVPQPGEGATYADRLTPEDRELDWNRPPTELLNQVRALSPHIGARGEVDGRRLTIWRARLANDDSPLTAGGLELVDVQPEGRRRMSGEEYLRGLKGSGSGLE